MDRARRADRSSVSSTHHRLLQTPGFQRYPGYAGADLRGRTTMAAAPEQ